MMRTETLDGIVVRKLFDRPFDDHEKAALRKLGSATASIVVADVAPVTLRVRRHRARKNARARSLLSAA